MSLVPCADCVDSYVGGDLAAGAVEFEAESWSLSVEHKFCKKQDEQEVKRQDVIYGEDTEVYSDAHVAPRYLCL